MNTKNLFFRWPFLTILAVLIAALLVSCQYNEPNVETMCEIIRDATLKPLTDSDHGTNPPVFDDGTIFVYHGFGCAESKKLNNNGTQVLIKVEQSLDIPAYATNATVFLNGWHLKYLDSDHHVHDLTTFIRDIGLERGKLTWHAIGGLGDDNFDDPYNWCYYYTVVAWNPSNINLTVDYKDGSCDFNVDDPSKANFFFARNDGTTTALSSFPSFLQDPDFATTKTVAILPRGFGFNLVGTDDHHLLQIGYNLDHREIFVENGKKYKKKFTDVTPLPVSTPTLASSLSQVDSGFVSWETYAIFKDNDTRRGYQFGEIVSGLGGNDVEVV